MIVTIGVDPGDSMGLAVFEDAELVLPYQAPSELAMIQLENVLYLHQSTIEVTIACERYVEMRRRHGGRTHQPKAQQLYGAVEDQARRYGARFLTQSAADAHAVASAEWLRRAGLWVAPSLVQARDADDVNMAVRHAVLALSREHATIFDVITRRAEQL